MKKNRKRKFFHNKFSLFLLSIFLLLSSFSLGVIGVGYSADFSEVHVYDNCLQAGVNDKKDAQNFILQSDGNTLVGDVWGSVGSNRNETLTFTFLNAETSLGFLGFNYKVELENKNCTCNINGVSYKNGDTGYFGNERDSNGNFTKKDEAIFNSNKKSIDIYIAGYVGPKHAKITISNIKCESITEKFSVTYQVPENGTYTYNNVLMTPNSQETVIDESKKYSITLNATPYDGYYFDCWVIGDKKYFENPYTHIVTEPVTIYPVFISNSLDLIFSNNGKQFAYLSDAVAYAESSTDKTIYLEKDGTLLDKECTITSGITLFIPLSDTEKNTIKDESVIVEKDLGQPSAFRTLTIPSNSVITFEKGSCFYIDGRGVSAQTGGNACSGGPRGPYGKVMLEEQSLIILKNGAEMYIHGYVVGKGLIDAQSGALVTEFFQVLGWRGGTCSLNEIHGLIVAAEGRKKKVFIMNQYSVHNCEAKLKINSGCSLKVFTGVYALSKNFAFEVTFIGNSSEGLFRINSGYIIKEYIPEKGYNNDYMDDADRLLVSVYGNVTISSLALKISGYSIDSAEYVLPITNNITIAIKNKYDESGLNIVSNSSLHSTQDVAFLPGSKLIIDEQCHLYIEKTGKTNESMYIYDSTSWVKKGFAISGMDEISTHYSATINKKPSIRYPNSNNDAYVDINGTIHVQDGTGFYTTENSSSKEGANIISSKGTGKIIYSANFDSSQTATYQIVQSSPSTFPEVPITVAKLTNSDGTMFYKDGSSLKDTTVSYSSGFWHVGGLYKITFINYKNQSQIKDIEYYDGKEFIFPTGEALGFSYPNYSKFKVRKYQVKNTFLTYNPEEKVTLKDQGDLVIYAYFGGWIETNNKVYNYIDFNSGSYLTGLNKVETIKGGSPKIHLFNDDGTFNSSYNGTYTSKKDNKTYYLKNGIVSEGNDFIIVDNKIMYLTKTNSIYKSLNNVYINTSNITNSILPSGYYSFDNEGYIIKKDTSLSTISLSGDTYIYDNTYLCKYGISIDLGLFKTSSNNYVYTDTNGKLIKNQTYYIDRLNGYDSTYIKEGLYYFDSNGYLNIKNNGTLVPLSN